MDTFEQRGWTVLPGTHARRAGETDRPWVDVADPAWAAGVAAGGPLDAVVFAQGANTSGGIQETTAADLDEMWQANVVVVAEVTRSLLDAGRAGGSVTHRRDQLGVAGPRAGRQGRLHDVEGRRRGPRAGAGGRACAGGRARQRRPARCPRHPDDPRAPEPGVDRPGHGRHAGGSPGDGRRCRPRDVLARVRRQHRGDGESITVDLGWTVARRV